MTDSFKPGDVVRLKSGGPPMTILVVHNNAFARLAWFEGEKLVVRGNTSEELLPLDALEHVQPAR